MKVWIKYLIGVALGVLAAFILPTENAAFLSFLSFLSDLFIRMGRYVVLPLVFFTAIVSLNNLRNSKLLWRTAGWTFLIIILSSLLLTAVGMISILLVKLPRIPITVDVASDVFQLNVKDMLLSLFPDSAFSAILEGSFLLVPLVFAFLIGWESASEELTFKPLYTFADSASKLFYAIANFFTEILAVCAVIISAFWIVKFRDVIAPGIYTPMIIMFLIDFVIVVGLIYPLILRFVCHDPHPYRVLYASLASLIFSFFTADSNITLPLNYRHARESLGIRRRCRGFTYPLFSIFARGGSALTASISFILIWRSYSSLSIPFTDILWIFGLSFGLSFLLGGLPTGGSFILLTILCAKYAKGFETSFLLLQPASMIMCSFAAMFDTATAMFGSYIVSVKTKTIEHHTIQHFI
ncbi:MAG: cation:dicarboxylase symporter family transporter [Treponema sp.]|nr:cation:dicarboxylase symporter family transporter [Treponema sp.]